ncbi:hypothetical protein [Streptomyces sp. AC550_RSS872]|uniref:hypothetical protein n=1 Tax=Streptomyces sp. AC550_RSS872 TaxID=2823689 RepID=UPI001C269949|nr:hypothetical protein [Streptomyces sp. AC550_RSS872]
MFCSSKCKAAARRDRRHRVETTSIAIAFINGEETEQVVTRPVCGTRFALGHGPP